MKKHGIDVLFDPLLNKGTAFTLEERRELGILGLLPHHFSSMEEQLNRRYSNFLACPTNLAKYKMLTSLQDRNETLFFRLLHEHVDEMLSYIYTPTVGEASVAFSHHYNQTRGIYLPYELRDEMDTMIEAIPTEDVQVIVVTDGSRILGLGDMGAGGMVIPVGKLALYTLFGGIHPGKVLPVLLDVGTNNEELLKDDLYLGWQHPRIEGDEYYDFIEKFIRSVKKRYPKALIQWEDFQRDHALPLLEKYRHDICSFNDDIQGTATVVLAGLQAAVKTFGGKMADQRICIVGGGSAGLGIANLLARSLEREGLSKQEALDRIFIQDRIGLINDECREIREELKPFMKGAKEWGVSDRCGITLEETVELGKITMLIGVCAQSGIFTEKVIRKVAANTEHPIIFPLSNPTVKAEAVPDDIYKWTNGKALVATGSPFPPVNFNDTLHAVSQCNNVYIFPGVGLGAIASEASEISEEMFLKAADTLSTLAIEWRSDKTALFPPFSRLREASKKIAFEVAQISNGKAVTMEDIESIMWFPSY